MITKNLNFVEAVKLLSNKGGYITTHEGVIWSQNSRQCELDVWIIPKGSCVLRCVRVGKGDMNRIDPTIRTISVYLADDFIHVDSDNYMNAWHECLAFVLSGEIDAI